MSAGRSQVASNGWTPSSSAAGTVERRDLMRQPARDDLVVRSINLTREDEASRDLLAEDQTRSAETALDDARDDARRLLDKRDAQPIGRRDARAVRRCRTPREQGGEARADAATASAVPRPRTWSGTWRTSPLPANAPSASTRRSSVHPVVGRPSRWSTSNARKTAGRSPASDGPAARRLPRAARSGLPWASSTAMTPSSTAGRPSGELTVSATSGNRRPRSRRVSPWRRTGLSGRGTAGPHAVPVDAEQPVADRRTDPSREPTPRAGCARAAAAASGCERAAVRRPPVAAARDKPALIATPGPRSLRRPAPARGLRGFRSSAASSSPASDCGATSRLPPRP